MKYHDHTQDERPEEMYARTGKPHLYLWSPCTDWRGEWLFEGPHTKAMYDWCNAQDDREGR